MGNKSWFTIHALSILGALFITKLFIPFGGISGFIITVFIIGFSFITALRHYRNYAPYLQEIDSQEESIHYSASAVLFADFPGVFDKRTGLVFYSLLNPLNYLSTLAISSVMYLLGMCLISFATQSGVFSLLDFLLLIAQSLITFISLSIALFMLLQMPNLIKFLRLRSQDVDNTVRIEDLSKENTMSATTITAPVSFWGSLFGFKRSPKKGYVSKKMLKIDDMAPAKVRERLQPALDVMSNEYALRFKRLYVNAAKLSEELESVINDFGLQEDTFSKELDLVNDIVNVFVPTTVNNCRKSFGNTDLTEEMKKLFRANLERPMATKMRHYEIGLSMAQDRIAQIRLSPFDTSEIDAYVSEAHKIHRQISRASGVITNKHLVISQSVMNDLLPSLLKTWSMANTQEQKDDILNQFKDLIAFLEKQLNSLECSDSSKKALSSQQQLLTLDNRKLGSLSELNQQIGKNGRYLEILKKDWS